MFVWPHKLILKTCGTTALLLGLRSLLRIATDLARLGPVWRCFYSRKTFMFPERQVGPHRDWTQETKYLDDVFGEGSAYTVGKINGDHWLLYLTSPVSESLPSNFNSLELSSSPLPQPKQRPPPDQTLEILMTGLDPNACQSFFHPGPSEEADGHVIGTVLSHRLGLDTLLPNSELDAYLFSPCGYSANILQGDRYATVHVTPEMEYSYASFETNAEFGVDGNLNLSDLITKVLSIFGPDRLSITLFVSKDDQAVADLGHTHDKLESLLGHGLIKGWEGRDRILYDFDDYYLLFLEMRRVKNVALGR